MFFSLTLMGLCHSLIEDTMLMVMIGAHLSGILWARLVFAILAVALVVKSHPKTSRRVLRPLSVGSPAGDPFLT